MDCSAYRSFIRFIHNVLPTYYILDRSVTLASYTLETPVLRETRPAIRFAHAHRRLCSNSISSGTMPETPNAQCRALSTSSSTWDRPAGNSAGNSRPREIPRQRERPVKEGDGRGISGAGGLWRRARSGAGPRCRCKGTAESRG